MKYIKSGGILTHQWLMNVYLRLERKNHFKNNYSDFQCHG